MVFKYSSLLLPLLLTSATLNAQTSSATVDDNVIEGDDSTLEEVIVTARHRKEPLIQAPLAISVFDEYQLQQNQIHTMNDLSRFAPGFTVSNYNKATPQFYIRGIGTNTSGASDDPSIAYYVDDVYIARPGFIDTDIFNIASIDVLRGPQGSLYGKNASGGVIRLQHKLPSDKSDIKLSLRTGNYQRQDFQAYINGAIAVNWQANLAISQRKQEGYVENPITGEDERDENSHSLHTQLLFQAMDTLSIRWIIDANTVDQGGNGRGLVGAPLFGLLDTMSLNIYAQTDSPTNGFTQSDDAGLTMHVDYDSEYWHWKSITAYRSGNYQFQDEILPISLTHVLLNSADEDAKQFSEEIRGIYDWSENNNLVVGLYFLQEDTERLEHSDIRGLGPVFMVPEAATPLLLNTFDATNTTTSYGIFSDFDIQIASDWILSFGARYTIEEKHFQSCATGGDLLGFGFLLAPYCGVDEKESWSDLSPRSSLSFAISTNQRAYISYSEGFKSGAFNSLASTESAARTPVDPEQTKQWELGYKAQWPPQRLRFSAVVFNLDYKDLQVFQISSGIITVENAAEANSKGLELELNHSPTDDWELSLTYAYLHSQYENYIDPNGEDFSGNQLMRAPKNSFSAAVSYHFPSLAGQTSIHLDYSYQDDMFFLASNDPLSQAPAYSLWNLQLQWLSANEQWLTSLWVKNLLDEEYTVFVIPVSDTQTVVPGSPLNYGITLNYSFF
ncbi:MAG: TonB-dependent receptor [Pseudomonadales bacterium]|nr:TonB-dependent receptor [Pseudomonadales bacterium]